MMRSKNASFLFDRNYLEYHAHRFTDSSLLVYEGARVVAILPANRVDDVLVSHGGLTYGGFLSDGDMTAELMLRVFDAAVDWLRRAGIRKFIYKAIPHIYHRQPAEEDSYALFRMGFSLSRRDLSQTVDLRASPAPRRTKGRKWSLNRAKKNGLTPVESRDFAPFMALEAEVLRERHGVSPVHSGEEMSLLASRFPENIRLFTVSRGDQLLAGVVAYDSGVAVHAQYIAASDAGRELGAADSIIDHLLTRVFQDRRFFDFGISTVEEGRVLNAGLAQWKESFGARATAYDFYELKLGGVDQES
ncbi:MAG: GNAT family N-acetyltransferase [Myxococcales bacterium]|nr:GNAT family N-acetyltransferase [Myxococcales bacterium]